MVTKSKDLNTNNILVHNKMTTKIYIAVEGTCTTGPDENLFQILREIGEGKRKREFSDKLSRNITGGGTVLWVRSDKSRIYMIDTGDYDDRNTLERSLDLIEKEEKIHPRTSVTSIYHTHSHLDHIGNNDLFPYSNWMVDQNDALVELMLGQKDTDAYKGFRKFYEDHRKRGITSDKFKAYESNNHANKPQGLTIVNTPGHERVHKGFLIDDDEVIVTNLETGDEYKTKGIVFTGDCLCDKRYLKRFLNPNPDVKKTAIYGNKIPTEDWVVPVGQADRNALDKQNLESMAKIVDAAKERLMIFGHGGVYNSGKR